MRYVRSYGDWLSGAILAGVGAFLTYLLFSLGQGRLLPHSFSGSVVLAFRLAPGIFCFWIGLHCAGDWEEYEVTAGGTRLVRTQVRLFRRKQESISISGEKVTVARRGTDRVGFGTYGAWEMKAPGAAVSGMEQSLYIGRAEMVLLVTILLQNTGVAVRFDDGSSPHIQQGAPGPA